MKNQNSISEKNQISNVDAANIAKAKIDLSKIDFSGIEISGRSISSKSLYKGTEQMGTDEKKEFRRKLRRDLKNLCSDILGKDRTIEERTKAIEKFMEFYKKNWRITDFKIENFTEVKNESDLKTYKNLLSVVSRALGN